MKKGVTQQNIIDKVDELMELLQNFEGSKSDAAEYICTQTIIWGADNHYEGLGILNEVIFQWRELSLQNVEEENEKEEWEIKFPDLKN